MHANPLPTRRAALQAGAAAVAAVSAADLLADSPKPNGHIKQSICKWCYPKQTLEELADKSSKMGYKSIELLRPSDVLKLKPFGMTCAVLGGADIVNGLNREANHAKILKQLREDLEFCADNGVPSVICMSGNRTIKGVTVSDEEGMETCARALKQVVGLAEQKKVTIVMEGLNSKVNHKDYMFDKTSWGVDLCKKVGSDRFKILWDIYHMAVMGEDVIPMLKATKDYIAHYHTGGVPGRNEIDDTQTLKYGEIVRAILDTGFTGYIAQEFIPKRDPMTSLAQAFKICDV
jgi:hydroxypyruvate isomerase